jgi:hypothetical protein
MAPFGADPFAQQHAQFMAAQAAAHTELAGQASSMQATMQNIAQATALGAQTAMHGAQTAAGAAAYGASSAFGSVLSTGQMAGSYFSGPQPIQGDPAGVGVQDVFHGASIGGTAAGGLLAGFVGWDIGSRISPVGFGAVGKAWHGGMAAGGIRGALAGGVGAVGAGAAALAIPLAASMAVERVFSIGAEQMNTIRDVNGILSNNMSRFMPFDPGREADPTAITFRREAQEITSHLGRMQEIGRANVGRFMEMGIGLGLFEGAGAEGGDGIVQKAKELADAVRDMTRLLGTSMEEGLQVMGDLRQTGMDPSRATGVAMGLQGMARFSGYSAADLHAAGMAGAAQFRGMGIGPEFGYQAATQNLATVTNMTQTGAIPLWLQASLGGREAAANAMTQGIGGFVTSDIGRAYSLAYNQGVTGGNFQDVVSASAGALQGNRAEMAATLGNIGNLQREQGPALQQAMRSQMLLGAATQTMGAQNFAGLDQAAQINAMTHLLMQSPRLANAMGVQTADQARLAATTALTAGPALQNQAAAMQMTMEQTVTNEYLSRNYGVRGLMYRGRQALTNVGQDIGDIAGEAYVGIADPVQRMVSDVGHFFAGTRVVDQGFDVDQLVREMRSSYRPAAMRMSTSRSSELRRLGLVRSVNDFREARYDITPAIAGGDDYDPQSQYLLEERREGVLDVVQRDRPDLGRTTLADLRTALGDLGTAFERGGRGILKEADEAILENMAMRALEAPRGGYDARMSSAEVRGFGETRALGILDETLSEIGDESLSERARGFKKIVRSGQAGLAQRYGKQNVPTSEIRYRNLEEVVKVYQREGTGRYGLKPEELMAFVASSDPFLQAMQAGATDPTAVAVRTLELAGFDDVQDDPKMKRFLTSLQVTAGRGTPTQAELNAAGETIAGALGITKAHLENRGFFETFGETVSVAYNTVLGRDVPTGWFGKLKGEQRTQFIQQLGRLRKIGQDIEADPSKRAAGLEEALEIRKSLMAGPLGGMKGEMPTVGRLLRAAEAGGDAWDTLANAMRTEGEQRIAAHYARAVQAIDVEGAGGSEARQKALASFKQDLSGVVGSPQELREFLQKESTNRIMDEHGAAIIGVTGDPALQKAFEAVRRGSKGERAGYEYTEEEEIESVSLIPGVRGQKVVARNQSQRATIDALVSANQGLRDTSQTIANLLQASQIHKDSLQRMQATNNSTQIGGPQSTARQ